MNANCRLVNPCIKVKSPSRCRVLYLAILAILYPNISAANPTHAQVISGQVSIDQSVAGVTTVTNSPSAIINWQDFNIAQHEITRFIQQNGQSAVLNRIVGGNPSEILGQLFSNGKVFLINPNGIVFGGGSQIDTQGLIASSLNLSNSDFQKGNFHFIAGSKVGDISNEGIIHAGKDGNIVLIAPNIENKGIIHSEGGKIVLAAGQELILTSMDNPEIRFQVQAPKNQVLNVGQLLTEGGAINVFAGSIKHSGDISADSVEIDKQGNIRLVAKGDVTLDKNSTISANNSKGDAGDIHVESLNGTTTVSGIIDAKTTQAGQGGKIEILAEKIAILNNTNLNASGKKGGGEILIGGDYQGKNIAVHNAKTTTVAEKVVINADAKTTGKGGKIVIWSDENTKVAATISAKGGIKSGDGGFVETSGKKLKIADTTKVSTQAPKGKAGTWLLEPTDFMIADTGGNITPAALSSNLTGGNVSVFSSSGSTGTNGDILVNSPVSWSANKLTLNAFRNIDINATLNGSGTAQLALEYGQGAANAGNTAIYNVRAPVNLPAGQNFSTKLGGDGDLTNGGLVNYTVINGPDELAKLTLLQSMNAALSDKYALGANIDAAATSGWNLNTGVTPNRYEGFLPVGNSTTAFTGKFDGLGHTISNLMINRSATNYVGLFGNGGVNFSDTIKNVGLLNENIMGSNYVGGVVGSYYRGTITNSYSTGIVSGTYYIGGLVGQVNSGAISDSYNSSTVNGSGRVGGVVGWDLWGIINNVYSTGAITGSNYVGGLIGDGNAGNVSNSYSTGNVTGTSQVGGLVGVNGVVVMTNSHYDVDSVIINGSHYLTEGGLYNPQYQSWFPAKSLNISTYLSSPDVNGYYGISTLQNLKDILGFVDNPTYKFKLSNDIDVFSLPNWYIPVFSGVEFNGAGHVLNNLSLQEPPIDSLGFMGVLKSATSLLVDIGITNSNINGSNDVGGLVGNNYGTITNSYNKGSVTAIDDSGGIAGVNHGTINIAYNNGTINSGYSAGGIAGWNQGAINGSYNTGKVSASSFGAGGLAGYNSNGVINNSYNLGNIGNSYSNNNGGLVGQNDSSNGIQNSYNVGLVSGSDKTGGLVGLGTATIINSFWDTQTSGQPSSAGSGGIGKTTAEMMTQSTFSDPSWNFTNTWWMSDTNTRPFLRSEWSTNITNAHQLQLMSSNLSASYTLGNNLDLSSELSNASEMWDTTKGFVPVGADAARFTGDFDGTNHTITGLKIDRPTTDYIGLFSYSNAANVQNIGLLRSSVTGQNFVSGLVGVNNGTVSNSYNTGVVLGSGTGSSVGGLVGWNVGTVNDSYNTGTVSGGHSVGGLVGSNSGTVSNSYSTGEVSGFSYVSGLVGANNDYGTINNSYYNIDNVLINGTHAVTEGGIYNTQYQTWLSGNKVPLLISAYLGSPVASYYSISNTQNLKDLLAFSNISGYKFKITNAIDLSIISAGWHIPYFKGTEFNGGNFELSHFSLTRSLNNPVGFIGRLGDGSTLTNVALTNGNVSGIDFVGSLVGNNNGTVINSYNTGTVSNSGNHVGGLVGSNSYGTISNSYNTGTVSALGHNVGGLAYGIYVGGLVGSNTYGTINNSYSTGYVSGDNSFVGGLVGYVNTGTITNNFWDTQTSGKSTSAGGTGLTTAQMMSASTLTALGTPNWNGIADTSYPYLSWQFATPPQIISGVLSGASISGKTIALAVDGVAKDILSTGANGFFYQTLPANSIASNQNLLVWLSNDGTNKAANLTNGSYLTDLKLELNTIYGQKDLDTAALLIAKGGLPNADIPFAFTSTFAPTVGILKANNDILLKNPVVTQGGSISLKAGKSVLLNTDSSISTNNGNIEIIANADTATDGINNAHRDAGQSIIQMQSGSNLNAGLGAGSVAILLRKRENDTPNNAGAITLTNVTGGNTTVTNDGYRVGDAGSGDVVLNGSLTLATGNTLTLNSTGSVTQSAPISASNLLLSGSGNYTLTNINNAIGTLAANSIGSLSLINSSALIIDTVNSISGISASGAIDIATYNGNLTVNRLISTTNTTFSALRLNAGSIETTTTNANIIVGTSGAFSVDTSISGIAKFFTGSIIGSTGLATLISAGNFRYNSDESVSNYTTPTTAAGKYAIYREQPKLRVTPNSATSIYGDGIATLFGSINTTDAINGDTSIMVGVTGTPTFNTTAIGISHVGGYDVAYASGYSSAIGYGFADDTISSGEYSITARTLTPTLTNTGVTKIYDGTTNAPSGFTPTYVYSGFAPLDATAALTFSTAAYSSKNVGTATQLTFSGLALSSITGTGAITDYVLDSTSKSVAAGITAAALNITATGIPKIYDGLTTATVSLSDDHIVGDSLTVSHSAASFANKNVGTAKPITVSGIALTGADAGNYTFNTSATTAADITAKALAITATGIPKIYDGLTTAQISLNDNRITNDGLTISNSTANFADKNVGAAKPITVSGIALTGADAGNYTFNTSATTAADITAKALLISATGSNKIYDGLTTA
ncbi:MAG: YDG domain-containing protein, partial [Methylococcaceae bacterium]